MESSTNAPRAVEIHLTPPTDVSFFSSETLELFRGEPLTWSPGNKYAGSLTWSVDVYKYCTGGAPTDPNFDGTIVFIFVHRGTVNIGEITYERQFLVWPEEGAPMRGTVQQPTTGSGIQEGNFWKYTIDYKETFPMLKNQGNETTTFDAIYREDFARERAQQTGYLWDDVNGVGSYIQYQSDPGHNASFQIKGLSVFKCRDLNAFPMNFTFRHLCHLNTKPGFDEYSAYATKNISISRGF